MHDCRECTHWDTCPCGKQGHDKGTSIGYSSGECTKYEEKQLDEVLDDIQEIQRDLEMSALIEDVEETMGIS